MKHIALGTALLLSACATAEAQTLACPPAGYSRAQLDALKASEWAIADDAARNAFARSLLPCLADPDPTMRDGIAFEALQHMMRARQLSPAAMTALQDELEVRMTYGDAQGFGSPFAALVMAEVARADRIEPYLTPQRRARLVETAVLYLANVGDYRGFDEREGWRHGVAHAADLAMQLSLNPAVGKPELIRIRDAVGAQIAPDGHFYTYGESERLARPIIYSAQRGLITQEEWTVWFAGLATASSENVYASQSGLAWRHNVNAFLYAIYANAKLSTNTEDDALLPGVEAAIRAMP